MNDMMGLFTTLVKVFSFNLLIYFLFTTKAIRYKHYRLVRIIFFKAHRTDYLESAKYGSKLFLELIDKVFGKTNKNDKFFSNAYFNKKMFMATYWISFSYIAISIIYLDYFHSVTPQERTIDNIISNFPTFAQNFFKEVVWSHLLLALYVLAPLFLTMAATLWISKKIKQSWFIPFVVFIIILFSNRWLINSMPVNADFESPIYIPLQFIVHGSNRFESLIGDLYLLSLLMFSVLALRIWWGTVFIIISYVLVVFRKIIEIGLDEGFSSNNFIFWFDRIVSSVSRSSILFLAPFLNFLVDCLSINISRFLFHRLSSVITWRNFLLILVYDLIFALMAFLSTPIIFLSLAALLDFFSFWEFSSQPLTSLLVSEYTSFFKGEIDARTWWIWLMLISTVFPSLLHASFVLFEIIIKAIEPMFRNFFYKGHYLLSEKATEEVTILKIKMHGYYRSIALIITSMCILEYSIYIISKTLLALK